MNVVKPNLVKSFAVMLLALFTRTVPHPPLTVPLFALGPFLGMSIALGVLAATLIAHGARAGHVAAILFGLTSLVSFGPQKLFAAEFAQIWPAVLFGMGCAFTLIVVGIGALRAAMSARDAGAANGLRSA